MTEPPPSRAAVTARLRAAGCVFAEDEAELLLTEVPPGALPDTIARRVAGEPLEHLLGWAEFVGLRIAVTPGVFVPRRRTEFLVRTALGLVRPGAVVVDLCCGSGAVGAALRAARPDVVLHAADVDPAAVDCARRNLPGAPVHLGDLFDALPTELRGGIDVLLAHAPYVPTDAIGSMPPEARDHEPRTALDGGPDGLRLVRRIVAAAPEWLARGGTLLFETSRDQADTAVAVVAAAGLAPAVTEDDDLDATVVSGTRRGR